MSLPPACETRCTRIEHVVLGSSSTSYGTSTKEIDLNTRLADGVEARVLKRKIALVDVIRAFIVSATRLRMEWTTVEFALPKDEAVAQGAEKLVFARSSGKPDESIVISRRANGSERNRKETQVEELSETDVERKLRFGVENETAEETKARTKKHSCSGSRSAGQGCYREIRISSTFCRPEEICKYLDG